MVVLLVIFTILFFVCLDWLIHHKNWANIKSKQEIYSHPTVGLTMADGGKKIEK